MEIAISALTAKTIVSVAATAACAFYMHLTRDRPVIEGVGWLAIIILLIWA